MVSLPAKLARLLRNIPAFYGCVLWKTKQTRTFLGIVEAMFFQQSQVQLQVPPTVESPRSRFFLWWDDFFVIYRWWFQVSTPWRNILIKMGRNLPQCSGWKYKIFELPPPSQVFFDWGFYIILLKYHWSNLPSNARLQVEQLNCEMGDPLNDTPFSNVKSKLLIDLYFKKKIRAAAHWHPKFTDPRKSGQPILRSQKPEKTQHEEMNASTLQRWWDRDFPEPKSRLFIQDYFFLGHGDTIITIQNGIV